MAPGFPRPRPRRARDPWTDELLPSQQELDAERSAASAPGTDTAWGGGIGGLAGGALGALLSIPSFGTLAPALIPAGMAAGGALGSAIGGSVGNDTANKAGSYLDAQALERQKRIAAMQERQAALQQLEATR